MPRIVHLRDITREDIRKSLSELKTSEPQTTSVHLDELPEYFYSPEGWPKNTKLQCRICNQVPVDFPRMVATCKFADASGNTVYGVCGPFHDWCCASLYITIYHRANAAELNMYLAEMEYMFSGCKKIKIAEANSQFLLRHYCGDKHGLTIEEWNRQNDEKTARETVHYPRLTNDSQR